MASCVVIHDCYTANMSNDTWPWPTHAEGERIARLLNAPDALVEEHRDGSLEIRVPGNPALWFTKITPDSPTPAFDPEGFLSSLWHPVVAESRDALEKRVTAIVSEAGVHGAHVRVRRPRDPWAPNLDAETRELKRRARRLKRQA